MFLGSCEELQKTFIAYKKKAYRDCDRIILSDPPCKDDNARFTIVPLKPVSDQ